MTDLLTNGSFEGPHTSFQSGQAPPNWTDIVGSPDLNRVSAGVGSATDGNDWLWFGAVETIEQTLTTPLTVGTTYSLTIDIDVATTDAGAARRWRSSGRLRVSAPRCGKR